MPMSAFFFSRLSASLQVVCAALLFSFSVSAQVTQTLGVLDVDRFGAAVYSLPISAPNGVAGVKPNITTLYNSQAANGLLGKGGSLGGLSVIKRCQQTLVRDGVNKAISWSAEDRFCIDAQRLMLISGTQGVAESQYKTEIDNGVIYTAKGGAAGNPDYFEANADDGATLVFGGVATAKEQGAATMTWALSQYRDVSNNAIEYIYEGAAADGLRIKRINYAFPIPNTTNDPGAYIEFIYRDRDDPISKYIAGYEFRTNKLLTQINSYSLLGLLHRSYQFDLATSSGLAGYVTRWQSVKECTSQTQCFDTTQFEWGRTQKNATTNQIETKNITMDFLGKIHGVYQSAEFGFESPQAADLNGNGIAEFFWVERGANSYNYMVSFDVASLSTDSPKFAFGIPYSAVTVGAPLAHNFADVNADGFLDLISPADSLDNSSRRLWRIGSIERTAHTWYLKNSGIGQLSTSRNNFVRAFDLDGDGFQEILGINHRSLNFGLHRFNRIAPQNLSTADYRGRSYFEDVFLRLTGVAKENGVFIEYRDDLLASGDFNNDGSKDLILLVKYGDPAIDKQTAQLNWYELKGSELILKKTIYEESRSPLETTIDSGGEYRLLKFESFGSLRIVDINGDGLDDIAFKKYTDWMYSINTGDGFLPFVTIAKTPGAYPVINPTFIDVNNDGSADYIYGETTPTLTNPSIYVRYWNSKIGGFNNPVLIRATPDKPILFADMNGDGFTDIVENRVDNTNTYVHAANVYGFTNNVGNTTVGFQGVLDQDAIVSIKTGTTTNSLIDYQTLVRPKNINVSSCTSGVSGINPCYDFASTSHYKPLKIDVPHNGNSLDAPIPSFVVNSTPYYTKTNEPFLGLNNTYAGAARVSQYVAPLPIVTRVKNNLVASDKKYYYEIMRTQSGGRGLLGFEKTSVEDVSTGIRTETFWRQDWPFTGLPTSKIVWNKFSKAMSEVENTLSVNQIDQSKVFKINVFNTVSKQYETGINDTVQGGLISVNNSSSSQSSSSVSSGYVSEPAILELLTPGERSIKYVAAGVSVGLKAVTLSKDGVLWKDSSGNSPVVKFYADDYTYLGESRADGTPFNWLPLASKTYSIKAKVFLDAGVTLQSKTAGIVALDATGYPTVEFLGTIKNGVKYFAGDIVNLIAKAEDKDGSIVNVKFYANNALIGTGNWNGGNYRFDWTPTAAGVYNIKAIATDSANNKSESKTLEIFYAVNSSSSSSAVSSASAVSLTLPLSYPLTNSALGESLYLGSGLKNSSGQQVYESDGSIPAVRFYANGSYVGESRADGYWFQWKPAAAGVYDVVAVAMLGGEQVVSQTALLIVKGSATANVELTAPKYNGAKYNLNNYVGMSVNINDNSFNISKVIFYANDQELFVDTTVPYSYAWMPSRNSVYTIKAVVVDVNGNTFASSQRVIHYGVDEFTASSSSAYSIPTSQSSSLSSVRDPVRFELTSPLERTSDTYGLGAEVLLAAPVIGIDGGTWTDAAGNVSQVDFYANEQLLTGLRKDPRGYYSFWKPTAAGSYGIKAVARINESKTITTGYGTVRIISANAPTVSLVHPVTDRFLKLGDSLNLVASASDVDGNLQTVEFYSNGERLDSHVQGNNPFNLLWTPYVTGEYLIRAEAMDLTHVKSTTGTVRITVVNPGTKPAVTLINPNNSSVPFGANLTLSADAIDYDGTIAKVEFYANDQLVGTATTKPYQINFNLQSAGRYSLKAIAYDNLDNSTASTISQIQHGMTPPVLSIIDPDDDCFYAINMNAPKDIASNLVYELYEREVGAAWSVTPIVQRSLSQGHIPSFKEYFHDHNPGNFEYRSRVCPINNLAACSPYSEVLPVFLYANCKSIVLPTVRLTNPPGIIELGNSVVVSADAKIVSNAIRNVRFFYGDKLIGVDSTAPYSITWTPTEPGRDYLFAQAEGFNEGTAVSDMHTVNVVPVGGHNSSSSSTASAISSQNSSLLNTGSSSGNNSSVGNNSSSGNNLPGSSSAISLFNFDTEAPAEFKSALGISTLPNLGQAQLVAITQGKLAVNNGAAAYSVDIDLPPAVRDLKPKLALTYNSQSGNGLLGVGWSLSGLSAITRCRANFATEGAEAQKSNPRYTMGDRLCLDGQKLVIASPSTPKNDSDYWATGYWPNGTEYKTELDNFARIAAYGSSANGGHGYFKVWTKDGRVLTYGAEENSQNSKIYAPNQEAGPIKAWALDKVEDAYGNSYSITYERNTASGEYYPQQINLGAIGLVVFTYQSRAGQTPWGYDVGHKYQHTKVLDKVTTYLGTTTTTPIKEYDIDYTLSATTNRELVEKIHDCGYEFGIRKCARPLTFDWQAGELGFELTPQPLAFTGPRYEDFNSDGYVDIIGTGLLAWGNANGTFTASGYTDAKPIQIIQTRQGKAAITSIRRTEGSTDYLDVYLNRMAPSAAMTSQLIATVTSGESMQAVDLNNDGLTDININNRFWIQQDDATFVPSSQTAGISNMTDTADISYVDVNGDGLLDQTRVTFYGYVPSTQNFNNVLSAHFNTGKSFGEASGLFGRVSSASPLAKIQGVGSSYAPIHMIYKANIGYWRNWIDINGDGNSDVLYNDQHTADLNILRKWAIQLSKGGGFVTTANFHGGGYCSYVQ